MIEKNELPILEYDTSSEEVIKPNHGAESLRLPEKCIYAFLGETVDNYACESGARIAETFETITREYPVYVAEQDGMEFCFCAAPLGAPAPKKRRLLRTDSVHSGLPCQCSEAR